MKEAQPTRTEREIFTDDSMRRSKPELIQENWALRNEVVSVRAELEQVRQLRESDALTTKIEYGNALGRAEAAEAREKRLKDLIANHQCPTWCDKCNCRASDCGCGVPVYRRFAAGEWHQCLTNRCPSEWQAESVSGEPPRAEPPTVTMSSQELLAGSRPSAPEPSGEPRKYTLDEIRNDPANMLYGIPLPELQKIIHEYRSKPESSSVDLQDEARKWLADEGFYSTDISRRNGQMIDKYLLEGVLAAFAAHLRGK